MTAIDLAREIFQVVQAEREFAGTAMLDGRTVEVKPMHPRSKGGFSDRAADMKVCGYRQRVPKNQFDPLASGDPAPAVLFLASRVSNLLRYILNGRHCLYIVVVVDDGENFIVGADRELWL